MKSWLWWISRENTYNLQLWKQKKRELGFAVYIYFKFRGEHMEDTGDTTVWWQSFDWAGQHQIRIKGQYLYIYHHGELHMKKKKKKEILKNSWEDIHQRSLQTIPDPKCSEPSVLHYTVIMKTNTDKFYTLRPTAYLNYWEKMVARGALWVWIFWIFCC